MPDADITQLQELAQQKRDLEMRLTLLDHWLRSALTEDGRPFTLMDRLRELGVPIDEVLAGTLPLASPPYTHEEFLRMLRRE